MFCYKHGYTECSSMVLSGGIRCASFQRNLKRLTWRINRRVVKFASVNRAMMSGFPRWPSVDNCALEYSASTSWPLTCCDLIVTSRDLVFDLMLTWCACVMYIALFCSDALSMQSCTHGLNWQRFLCYVLKFGSLVHCKTCFLYI